MTLDALRGGIPIATDHFAVRLPGHFVALGASDVSMSNVQGEPGAFVIEIGDAPAHGSVARRTILLASFLAELTSVSICLDVASGALAGSLREVGPRLAVAVDTLSLFMRAVDLERGLRVIERADPFPLRGGMAGVAR